MDLITGFDWMLSCTTQFEPTVEFVRDVLGLEIVASGPARIDTHFSRYACAALPSGDTLEVVEPTPSAGTMRGKQILCLIVHDAIQAKIELQRRGVMFASSVFNNGEGLGWFYIRAPDGNLYQVYGAA
jgi:catechol 2,3-dioxygenase-like lactoylglutathione lyase family enzyme